jgi:putative exporter of polyketide antibiotics
LSIELSFDHAKGIMAPRTLFLCRLLGLFCLLAGLTMLIRGREVGELVIAALLHNAPLMFIVGLLMLLGGLALVLLHNVWTGGVLPVVVTLIGWLTLAKGLLLISLSPEGAAQFYLGDLRYAQLYYVYAAFSLLIGAGLTYGGFRSRLNA